MSKAVSVNPRVMHGTPCFSGTRVPVSTLFDWIEQGHSLDYFLEEFPTVAREQAIDVLRQLTFPPISDVIPAWH